MLKDKQTMLYEIFKTKRNTPKHVQQGYRAAQRLNKAQIFHFMMNYIPRYSSPPTSTILCITLPNSLNGPNLPFVMIMWALSPTSSLE